MNTVNGSKLKPSARAEALRQFVHRFTRDHVPAWARKRMPDGSPYKVQFASDEDWLNNTTFTVTAEGDLDNCAKFCYSTPTWPRA